MKKRNLPKGVFPAGLYYAGQCAHLVSYMHDFGHGKGLELFYRQCRRKNTKIYVALVIDGDTSSTITVPLCPAHRPTTATHHRSKVHR